MKSALGKRPPDKAHSAPEKKLSSRISCSFAPLQTQKSSKKYVLRISDLIILAKFQPDILQILQIILQILQIL